MAKTRGSSAENHQFDDRVKKNKNKCRKKIVENQRGQGRGIYRRVSRSQKSPGEWANISVESVVQSYKNKDSSADLLHAPVEHVWGNMQMQKQKWQNEMHEEGKEVENPDGIRKTNKRLGFAANGDHAFQTRIKMGHTKDDERRKE